MKRFLLIAITLISLWQIPAALASDPGAVDSLAFGNLDGSPIEVFIDHEVSIPIYLKCDENLAFVHFCLATENEYIIERVDISVDEPLADWSVVAAIPVDGWQEAGRTAQSIVAIADFSLSEPNYINTNGEWVKVGDFIVKITNDIDAMGQTTELYDGEDPVEGVTMFFDETWSPIIPQKVFTPISILNAAPPVFVYPSPDTSITVNSLYSFSFTVSAEDVDGEDITITATCPYEGYTFEAMENIPGYAQYEFSWTPAQDCAELVPIEFLVTDVNGLADTETVNINVEPVTISVSGDTTLAGYSSTIDIYLIMAGDNSNVGAFDLLLSFDASVLTADSVAFSDDFADWEYLYVNLNNADEGTISLLGLANLVEGGVPPKHQGTYHIARFYFQTAPENDLQGMSIPLTMPYDDITQNALSDSSGYFVYNPVIIPGAVTFLDQDGIIIGDLNLNSYPYENGDAITFIDHLTNPVANPFNLIQKFSSDCNQDNITESIADLIYMLNVINGEGLVTGRIDHSYAEITLNRTSSSVTALVSGDIPVGGAYININHQGIQIANLRTSSGCDIHYNDTGDVLSIVVVPHTIGEAIGPELITFDIVTGESNQIAIDSYQLSTPQGSLIQK